MSINSLCTLPNDTRADDVVKAIAFLCGAKRIRTDLSHGGAVATWADRSEVQVEPDRQASHVWVQHTHDMQYFIIHIAPTDCDGEWHQASLFLYPEENRPNRILVYAGVSKFWHNIDRALVDLFGGEVDDQDCDEVDVDYQKRKPRKTNCPSDGQPWQKFEDAMFDLPVLFHFVEK